MVTFRIGAADAEFLEKEFAPAFEPVDLINLPKANILLKLMINGVSSEPFSAVTLPPISDQFTGNAEKVIKVSRERYANPVAEVEEKISRWMGAEFHEQTALLIGTEEADGQQEGSLVTSTEKDKNLLIKSEVFIEKPALPTASMENSNLAIPNEPRPRPVQESNKINFQETFKKKKKKKKKNFPASAKKPENPIWDLAHEIETDKQKTILDDSIAGSIDRILNHGIDLDKDDQSALHVPSEQQKKQILKPGEVRKFE
jgi:hypothetical protein